MLKLWMLIAATALMVISFGLVSCKHDDDGGSEPLPAGLQYVYGDTIYIIPDSAVAFAGPRDNPNNFDTRAYLWAEYQVATDTIVARQVYRGDFQSWFNLNWDQRYTSLPAPFTHHIMTDSVAAYYFMIGRYFSQFGWGWRDTYNRGAGWGDAVYPNLTPGSADWTHPVEGLRPDSTHTVAFDGDSRMFDRYRAMIIRRAR